MASALRSLQKPLKVLEKVAAAEGVTLEQTHYKLGAQHWLESGETLPDGGPREICERGMPSFSVPWELPRGTPGFRPES